MGVCTYCFENAGWFRKQHKACKEQYDFETKEIRRQLRELIQDSPGFESRLRDYRWESTAKIVPEYRVRQIALSTWENTVALFLEDGVLSAEEEDRLSRFAEKFDFGQIDLDSHGWFTRTVVSAMLRDISNGEIPDPMTYEGKIPFNLMKSETLVYVFPNTEYLQIRTKKHYEGGHHGASIRIASGLYYRLGSFKGRPVETAYSHSWGNGLLALTTKNMYFHSPQKSVRIPYRKVVSFDQYSDGIGFTRDNVSAKPEVFVTGDGWAVYNLAVNLARVFK